MDAEGARLTQQAVPGLAARRRALLMLVIEPADGGRMKTTSPPCARIFLTASTDSRMARSMAFGSIGAPSKGPQTVRACWRRRSLRSMPLHKYVCRSSVVSHTFQTER
jgi:hypothetical protein